MSKHAIKICPRCLQDFECKSSDITHCQCETVDLQQHHRNYVLNKYDDCLCASCLENLRAEYNGIQFKQKI